MTNDDTDLSTPEALMEAFVERLNRADLDGLVSLYEPDAVFEASPGTVVRGRSDIRRALAALLLVSPRITTETVQVLVAGDVALVVNEWALTGATPDGTAVRQAGRSADVVRRQPGGHWLVTIDKP
jgi:uncharacterized protein (TIGR02246 family)